MVSITDSGLAFIAQAITGAQTSGCKFIDIGSGRSEESASDTALVTEYKKQQITSSNGSISVSSGKFTATTTIIGDSTSGTIHEYGLLGGSSGGTLVLRHMEDAPVTVSDSQSVTVSLSIQFTEES